MSKNNNNTEYASAKQAANAWELGLEERYTEDKILSIMSMLSYLVNVDRGYGHLNNEALYRAERAEDANGRLYQETCKGLELTRKCRQLKPITIKTKKL